MLLIGVRGFDLEALVAATATATGGAVATELAQEAAAVYLPRIALLAVSGLFLGIGLSRVGTVAGAPTDALDEPRSLASILVAAAFALVPLRTPGETFLLSVSSNVRFVLALVVGLLAGGGLGALIEVSLIRPLYGRVYYQILLTLGLELRGHRAGQERLGDGRFLHGYPGVLQGGSGDNCPSPNLWSWFSDHCQSINVLGRPFPSYRLFIIALGLAMFIAIALLLQADAAGHHHPRGRARQRDGAGVGDQRAAGFHAGLRHRLRIGGGGRCGRGALPRRQPGTGRSRSSSRASSRW